MAGRGFLGGRFSRLGLSLDSEIMLLKNNLCTAIAVIWLFK